MSKKETVTIKNGVLLLNIHFFCCNFTTLQMCRAEKSSPVCLADSL